MCVLALCFYGCVMKRKHFLLLFLISSVLFGCQSLRKAGPTSQTIDLFNAAEKAYYTGQLSLAEERYRRLIKINPNYAKAYFRLGNIYVRTGQELAAIEMYRKSVHLKPEDAASWHNLAMTYLKLSQKTIEEGLAHPLETSTDQQMLFRLGGQLDGLLQN
jgi:tetratricopeptide (TPR) repeat protein